MNRVTHPIPVFALLLCVVGCQSLKPTADLDTAAVDLLTARAPFIFEGTVIRSDSSNVPSLRVTDATAVVSVDKVLKSPSGMSDYVSREITVMLKAPAQEGEQSIYFTNGLSFGRGLAVQELARIQSDKIELRNHTTRSIAEIPARMLREHVHSSELVVVGQVDAILSPPVSEEDFISEHDPRWRGAKILIASIESGQYGKSSLVVSFPLSQDVMWRDRPRFSVGQQGIWILHKHSADPTGINLFDAVHQSDFLPMQSLGFVKNQIAELQRIELNKESIQ